MILVQLIGGQPLPNLLPPLHLKPATTILVYTPQTELIKQRLEALLRDSSLQSDSICCDAYDIPAITEALDNKLSNYNEDLVFNLTGGTKAMVLAANQIAARKQADLVYLESERGQSVLYTYSYDEQSNLRSKERKILPELVSIDQFLDAHIGKGQWQATGPSKDTGGLFEQAVAKALKGLPNAEIKQGVRFLGSGNRPQADIDIVVRCGNQFARIECKSGGKITTLDAAKQLNLVTELLGTYTRKFIALTGKPNDDHLAVYEATRTTVIELSSFDGTHLSDADKTKLVGVIKQALSCA
ncbi:MAG: DUF1887 family CARF protein [Roseiflexus sp.]|nr:DUF1887 family CARF protein [Roseiflexus sp.]MDW8145050.1 DUF1887 family CARF protein [Roseiflexaceae bacterium]